MLKDEQVDNMNTYAALENKVKGDYKKEIDSVREEHKLEIKLLKKEVDKRDLQDKLLLYTTHSKKSVKTQTLIYKKTASSQTTFHPGIPSGLDVKNSDNVYKCKVCGLVFKSQQVLQEHDQAYTFCCWQCSICYGTIQEAQNHSC